MQLLQLIQYGMTQSFSVLLTNKIICSDVIVNHDSLGDYEGLDFNISSFSQNGLDDLFTIGTSKPVSIVQYWDSFSWAKYCHCLLPFDLSRMTIGNNSLHETFHQSMIEFLQTDIDGSLGFPLNPVIIDQLEKYLKTFYTPPLDNNNMIGLS
jgi:hypothetical protein